MEIESYLTDVYGPRVTNSPNARAAGEWTMGKMKEWKLENVHEETWPFGRGWSNEHTSAEMIAPRYFYLIAYPKVWTPGTNGPVTGDAVLAPMEKEEDFAKYKGQLKGKFVLTDAAAPDLKPHFEPDAHRYTDAELADLANEPIPGPRNEDRYRASFARSGNSRTRCRNSCWRKARRPGLRATAETMGPCSCSKADRAIPRIRRRSRG